jgi:hypothetical protein
MLGNLHVRFGVGAGAKLPGLHHVRNRRTPETSGRGSLADLACAYAVLESAHARRRLQVAEVLADELSEYQRPINEHYAIT